MPPYQCSDYVSSSLLSSWRSASSDRAMTREVTQCSVQSAVCAAPGATARQQQRSSSADSVRRLVKRFFVRKLGSKVPASKISHEAAQSVFGNYDDIEASVKGSTKGDSHWDLPPNYVDMIFTRDPVTNESRSEVVEKDED
jgi:hypothetical protein